MGSTLMATTSILLSSGLAAILSSTYSIKKPLGDSVFGAHGEFMVALKYVTLLLAFIFAFFFYSLSIRFLNQVNFLINIPCSTEDNTGYSGVSPEYVADLLEKGFVLNTVGNRVFYAALPLLLWLFGPILDNDKKNILAVQTLRNSIMSSTLMATTCVLICCGLLTFTSNIYSHRTYETTAFDNAGAITLAFKSATLLLAFLSVFVSQALSIMSLIQVGILINVLTMEGCTITQEHVYTLLRKGLFLNTIGNRLFFITLPLMLWLFGPILVFVCSLAMVPVFYNLDIVPGKTKAVVGARVANTCRENELLSA
ncbi:hypothetical protein J5N97_026711 [Dioscorea zingiberensis]|uniref:Uncharacterized protein n=1 Tax=Dioscorea zingiberensis TaxID=325984 RepID=A0A9D5C3H4_9LILI|nr:hypothetical protein J5N97_026711 [Dioscorea zingiberensis]